MEKKRNQLARGQGNSDFKSKSQDVSSKQSRRHQPESSNVNKQSNKNRNYYDKRPQTKKCGSTDQQPGTACETTGLMDDIELNSVFNHGSKKQNLNHLLNFHYYNAKESDIANGAFSKHGYHQQRGYSKKHSFNKEQYLQANCQFVVKADDGYDYSKFALCADALVEWEQVVKILVSSSEESQCPICLYPPKAAQITRCGHIFCFACMLHYLSLSDQTWRKCPICYESVHIKDLRSTTSKHNHRSYKVGDIINMDLMTREKGSLFVAKAGEIRNNLKGFFRNFSDGDEKLTYSKLVMASPSEILKIIEQERNELDFQLIEDGENCPESIFVQQALNLLKTKQQEQEKFIEDDKTKLEKLMSSTPGTPVAVFNEKNDASGEDLVDSHEKRHELIDECNLTVNDIDIVLVAAQNNNKHYYYYQAQNAQNVFLHSINSRILQEAYGSLEKAPTMIKGKIVQIECCTMNEDLRKRLKYLQHLPVSSVFEVVEIEFDVGFVSIDVINKFKDEIYHRQKRRQRQDRDERIREKKINEINDRQMGKIMKAAAVNMNLSSSAHFPECGSFADLPAFSLSTSDCSKSSNFSSSPAGPSFATMLTATANKSHKLWPSLSDSGPSTSSSFFGKNDIISSPQLKVVIDEDVDDDDLDCEVPAYKNQIGDCLANALAKSMSMKATKSGNKKKAKKTLLFASGLNFN